MKYARINYVSKEENKDTILKFMGAESEEKIIDLANAECKEISKDENASYTPDIQFLSAEDYNKIKKDELFNIIRRTYMNSFSDELTIRQVSNLLKDVDEFNKVLDYFLKRENVKKLIRKTVNSNKLSLKEYDSYVDRLSNELDDNSFSSILNELKNK